MPSPATHGFGLYGPDFGYPGGGFCVSVFLAVQTGSQVLVGQMREDPAWAREWAPNLPYYEGELRRKVFSGLRLPATYLRVGEAPEHAARRVWRDQLGFTDEPHLGTPRIVSEAGPSRRYPGEQHWDLLFLYPVAPPAGPLHAVPAHWERLEFRDRAALAPGDLVLTHGELLPLLGP
ncbi:MAG TPA: hypothetical protein VNZ52_15445 [Candidatus Thermoplasmatota archaeon]|nr:hypothetical protein [Candidatus Thermoplasmatota archaeon]